MDDEATSFARAHAIYAYSRRLRYADAECDEAQLHPQSATLLGPTMIEGLGRLTFRLERLERARAAEMIDPEPSPGTNRRTVT